MKKKYIKQIDKILDDIYYHLRFRKKYGICYVTFESAFDNPNKFLEDFKSFLRNYYKPSKKEHTPIIDMGMYYWWFSVYSRNKMPVEDWYAPRIEALIQYKEYLNKEVL